MNPDSPPVATSLGFDIGDKASELRKNARKEKSELLGQVQRAIASTTLARTEGDWRADIVSRKRCCSTESSVRLVGLAS